MDKRKIYKQRIISFSIIAAICIGYSFYKSSNIFNIGYKSVEDAVIHEKSISKNDIVMVLNSNNLYLIIYDKGPRKIAIGYSEKGKYFFDHTNPTDIFFKTVDSFNISIQKKHGKVMIIIMCLGCDIPNSVITDSLKSTFSYGHSEFTGLSDERWFLALDTLPQNYTISINGKSIATN